MTTFDKHAARYPYTNACGVHYSRVPELEHEITDVGLCPMVVQTSDHGYISVILPSGYGHILRCPDYNGDALDGIPYFRAVLLLNACKHFGFPAYDLEGNLLDLDVWGVEHPKHAHLDMRQLEKLFVEWWTPIEGSYREYDHHRVEIDVPRLLEDFNKNPTGVVRI